MIRGILDADLAAFRAAGADDEAIRRIFSLNAGEVFAAGRSAPAAAAPEPEALAASV